MVLSGRSGKDWQQGPSLVIDNGGPGTTVAPPPFHRGFHDVVKRAPLAGTGVHLQALSSRPAPALGACCLTYRICLQSGLQPLYAD